jgi:hypothetical protein
MTTEDYAREVLRAGEDLGITPKGIVIGFATVYTEASLGGVWYMWANRADPASLEYPYDKIGKDSKSSGLFQQQPPWWGTIADRMDPYRSALMFFRALDRLDYNSNRQTPGWYAQEVQGSSYPDRYDTRMAEAQRLYDKLKADQSVTVTKPEDPTMQELDWTGQSANHSSRYGAAVRFFVLHTEEGNSDAYQLHEWMKSHDVSYHYILAKGVCIDHVDTDRASWSVLDANGYCINAVFAGSKAGQSRQQWIDRYSAEIDYAAKLFVQDAEKYGPLVPVVLGRDYDNIARSNGGIDHSGITYGLGIGDHTDVGPNFPWDLFVSAVERYATGAPVTPIVNAIDQAAAAAPWLGARLTQGEATCPDGVGRYAHFEHGFIHWTPTTGARPQPLEVFEVWEQLGYEGGPLGYPVNYHTELPVGEAVKVGVVQSFEGGTIYRQTDKPGYWVHGAIGNRWAREGFERSGWGWPISNEVPVEGGGAYQDFEGGRIAWAVDGTVGLSPKDGRDTVVPPIHT